MRTRAVLSDLGNTLVGYYTSAELPGVRHRCLRWWAFGYFDWIDEAGPFGSGLAPVKIGARTGFIDKSGNMAFDLAFAGASGFLRGHEEYNEFVADAKASRFWTADDKFRYVNTSGKVIWGPTNGCDRTADARHTEQSFLLRLESTPRACRPAPPVKSRGGMRR